jgi:enoyl-CoA hydratase/carnithine racemase
MSIFGDGFDAEDAFTIGGAMGFAEESMQAEEEGLKDDPELPEELSGEIKEVNLRIFKNTNPTLFRYIVNLVLRQKREWRKKLDMMHSDETDAELKALEETEKLLKEDENAD